jgi:hypothetical protein
MESECASWRRVSWGRKIPGFSSVPDQPATKRFCYHRFARHRKSPRPLPLDPNAVAARTRKGEIDQFNLELVPGFVINEHERMMRIWGGIPPSYRHNQK